MQSRPRLVSRIDDVVLVLARCFPEVLLRSSPKFPPRHFTLPTLPLLSLGLVVQSEMRDMLE